MALGERIIEWLGGITRSELDTATNRAYEEGYYDGNDDPQSGDIAGGGFGYTSASAGQGAVPAIAPERAYQIAWQLYQSNPVARRIIRIKRDYIIKRGVSPQTGDPKLQEILDEFWALNKLDVRALEFAGQLFALGEQCFPLFVRESDGQTRLAYFGPDQIERVIADPNNAMEFYAVVIKAQAVTTDGWASTHGKRIYRLARRAEHGEHEGRWVTAQQAELATWEAKLLETFGKAKYDGTALFYRVNAVSNQTRGQSDLLALADWLDQTDETLFGLGEREQFGGYFSWDVEIEGASPEDIKRRQKELMRSPPQRGSVIVHNEKERWSLNAPDLKQSGSIEAYKGLLTHVLGGAGLPQSWYGYGDETNRATAQAQADPTWRSMEADQGTVRGMLLDFCEFARDQAIIAGRYMPSADADTEIDVPMPEMTTKDVGRLTQSLVALVNALMVGVDMAWMPEEHAQAVLYKVLDELGLDIAPPDDDEIAPAQTRAEPDDDEGIEAWARELARLEPVLG